ncbi:MAG: VWA domain-containing protein [Acidobacteria bacterium]|nr:VWA domain-containing protein [Acidobacteriota bacterium]
MSRHPRRLIPVLLLLFLSVTGRAEEASEGQAPPSSGGATPQEPNPPAPQQPTFRAGINFVRVDVIVTDKQGTPVADLRQADFEVFEDGKLQTVESFKLINITGVPQPGAEPARQIRSPSDEEAEAAREDVRLFAIFLDDYHVRRGASMAIREPLMRFLTTQLGPLDMVVAMYPLTPLSDLLMTRDHDAVAGAIQKFEGRKYDYTPRNQFEDQYSLYPATTVEQIRNQVSLSGLKSLVTHLGALREGRKTIIVVSEGYTNILPPQLRDPVASVPGLGNPNRGNPSSGEDSPREQSAAFFADADIQTDLREVYGNANRNNTSIYTLDPRGLASFEFDINEGVGMRTDRAYLQSTMDTLRVLAENTDGRALVGRNDMENALRQVVRDSSAYYLIGYNSSQAPSDGRFHEIKVRVKRPGVQVRARKGYWALTAEETARALAPKPPGPPSAVGHALATIAEPVRARRLVRTWIGTERAGGGRTRVTFIWELQPPVAGLDREDVARVAVAASGAGKAYFKGRVPDEVGSGNPGTRGASDGSSDGKIPAGARAVFDAEPGRMQIRLSVEDTEGKVIDTDMVEITVPDFTSPQVAVSTPEVVRARNGLELKTAMNDPDALPTVAREFRRTDRLLIRFEAYVPGEASPTTSAQLLNRSGNSMAQLPVGAGAAGTYQIDLPLASLPPGEYLVELKVASAGSEAKELVAFRVIS